MRYLGLIWRGLVFCLVHLPLLAVCATPLLLVGYSVRRRGAEKDERPVDRAEVGAFDDDDDPERRKWKADFLISENFGRLGKALADSSWEPTVPFEVWKAERRARRQAQG